MSILKRHASHVANLRSIPILGLSKDAAWAIMGDDEGTPFLFIHTLATLLKAASIQSTYETEDLGKWLVITHKDNYDHAVDSLIATFPQYF